MANEYPENVRREARRLWLSGYLSDEEVAAKLGIPRADTIRDWRHAEGWVDLARTIRDVVDQQVRVRVGEERGAFRSKYDNLAQAIEGRTIRALSNPDLPPRDLKQLAGTVAQTQRIRERALGAEAGAEGGEAMDLATALQRAKERREAKRRGNGLGRCLGKAPIDEPPTPGTAGCTETSTRPN